MARFCGLEKFKDNDSGGTSMIYVALLSPSSLAAAHAHIMTGSGLAFTISQKKSFQSARVERPQDFTFFPQYNTGKLSFSLTRLDFFLFVSSASFTAATTDSSSFEAKKYCTKFSFCSLLAFGVAESKANLSLFGDFVTVRALQPLKVLVASL